MQAFILHLSSFLPRLVGETTRRLAANPLLRIGAYRMRYNFAIRKAAWYVEPCQAVRVRRM